MMANEPELDYWQELEFQKMFKRKMREQASEAMWATLEDPQYQEGKHDYYQDEPE